MSREVVVSVLPKCDFCPSKAEYDGRTEWGPWASMCVIHWALHGVGKLGTGYGQRLVLRSLPSEGGGALG